MQLAESKLRAQHDRDARRDAKEAAQTAETGYWQEREDLCVRTHEALELPRVKTGLSPGQFAKVLEVFQMLQ